MLGYVVLLTYYVGRTEDEKYVGLQIDKKRVIAPKIGITLTQNRQKCEDRLNNLRMNPVVFCGENPNIILVDAVNESITAAVSYWDCAYSSYGEGHVLLIYLDAKNASALDHARIAIYADNAPLARYLTDTFNQHFEDWQQFGFSGAAVEQARFSKDSDSREFYRISCASGQNQIDLVWDDIRDRSFRTFPT